MYFVRHLWHYRLSVCNLCTLADGSVLVKNFLHEWLALCRGYSDAKFQQSTSRCFLLEKVYHTANSLCPNAWWYHYLILVLQPGRWKKQRRACGGLQNVEAVMFLQKTCLLLIILLGFDFEQVGYSHIYCLYSKVVYCCCCRYILVQRVVIFGQFQVAAHTNSWIATEWLHIHHDNSNRNCCRLYHVFSSDSWAFLLGH